MNWTLFDFAVAGAMLAILGGTAALLMLKAGDWFYRLGMMGIVGTGVFLFISTGAVGIIGSEANDANMLYMLIILGVPAGSILVRFRPAGMRRVAIGAAIAQIAVPVIAWIGRIDLTPHSSLGDTAIITLFFCLLWAASTILLGKASALDTVRAG